MKNKDKILIIKKTPKTDIYFKFIKINNFKNNIYIANDIQYIIFNNDNQSRLPDNDFNKHKLLIKRMLQNEDTCVICMENKLNIFNCSQCASPLCNVCINKIIISENNIDNISEIVEQNINICCPICKNNLNDDIKIKEIFNN